MLTAYRILTNILYPFLFIFLLVRIFSKNEDPMRFGEKILVKKFKAKRILNLKLIWFHAASIGEFKSIIPIIKNLNSEYKNFQFLITTNTLSSSAIALTELKKFNNAQHRFMPFDINFLIEKFIESWKPEKIFLVDSEIWPNLIIKAHEKRIPLGLINARLTKKSYLRWSRFPKTAKKIFNFISLSLCANKETQKYLNKLHARNIIYAGNIKFTNNIQLIKFKNNNDKILSKLRFWLAVSIHKEEEIFCLKTHIELKKRYNNIVTIIAPRHLNKIERIKKLSENFKLKTQILNDNDEISNNAEIIIINSFGVLQKYFRYAKSVFVGKSMIKRLENDSGQNPIDAAKFDCKIYHGPYVSNFNEVYEILKKENFSYLINNYNELCHNLIRDLQNPVKKNILGSNSIDNLGKEILSNTMIEIKKFLNDKI